MRIGIIGAGSVGGTLGQGWAKKGHEVLFGVRDQADPKIQKLLADAGQAASAGSVAEAGAFGEVLVLATPWEAAEGALRQAGDLDGKIVFDCTNPLKPGLAGVEVPAAGSGGQQVAAWAPGARVVKIFNTTGFNNMADPSYPGQGGQGITMFYCGDDKDAKARAHQLAEDLGFDPVDAGPLANAGLLESLAMLWIWLAYPGGQGRDIALTLLRR
jgi:predicted dinucleotide-binding enzyme